MQHLLPPAPLLMETRSIFPVSMQLRQVDNISQLLGEFKYNTLAVVRNRGTVRKETVLSHAFDFTLNDRLRNIHLLYGHDYSKPLASRDAGSLTLESTDDALTFEADLPEESAWPSWMRDAVYALEAGLIGGLSPGFKIPPKTAVPDAERLVPEPGNPGVMIRQIAAAILYELSLVSLPAYRETDVEMRAEDFRQVDVKRRLHLCL